MRISQTLYYGQANPMSFDLESHIKDHAYYFHKNAPVTKESLHFTFSFLDLQFLYRMVGETMKELLQALLVPAAYKVANGKRKNRHGKIVQKFTTRTVDLSRDVQVMAIHLKGPEGEDTMPHIHFILDGKARFGRAFSLLKRHISEVSESFALVPHFDEITKHHALSVSSLGKAVRQITWSWKRATHDQLKKEIAKKGLNSSITLLESYTLKTGNLSYYIKSMESLKRRLNRMRLDLFHGEHNLRHTYPIPLTQEDMAVISLIKARRFSQDEMLPYLNNPILRDFIRHSAIMGKPYILDALKEQTSLLEGVYANGIAVSNYRSLLFRETPQRKSQLTPSSHQRFLHHDILRRIILDVAQCATSFAHFQTMMQQAGYDAFDLARRDRKPVGFTYRDYGITRSVHLTELGIRWGQLVQRFDQNRRRQENMEPLPDPTLTRASLAEQEQEPTPFVKWTPMPQKVNITYHPEKILRKKEKAATLAQNRRTYADKIRKLEEKIQRIEEEIGREADRTGLGFHDAIHGLKRHIQQAAAGIEKIPSLEKEIAAEEAKNRQILSEIGTLEADIKNESERHKTLRSDIAAEERQIEEAQSLLRTLEAGEYERLLCQELESELGKRSTENERLEREIESIESAIASTLQDETAPSPAPSPAPGGMRRR